MPLACFESLKVSYALYNVMLRNKQIELINSMCYRRKAYGNWKQKSMVVDE